MQLKDIATINGRYPFRGKLLPVPASPVIAVRMKDACPNQGIHWANCQSAQLPGKRTPDWLIPRSPLCRNGGGGIRAKRPPGRGRTHFYVVRRQAAYCRAVAAQRNAQRRLGAITQDLLNNT